MKKGAVFVDHTTASAEVARELDAAAAKGGFKFVDGPVSGGQAGAENGALTVMCGGNEDAYAAAEPIINFLNGQDPRVAHGQAVPVTCPIRPWHTGTSGHSWALPPAA